VNIHFDSIESTNSFCKKFQYLFPKKGVSSVSAETQTKGRGRFERVWISEKGKSLNLSYVFYTETKHPLVHLPQVLAISFCEVLNTNGLKIKWPNDLILNEKKIGGLLCEIVQEKEECFVVLGIGVNIFQEAPFFKNLTEATSLFLEGISLDIDVLKTALTQQFKENLPLFLEKGFLPFYSTFKELSSFSKGDMLYSLNQEIKGRYQGVSLDGGLILEMEEGNHQVFFSGEFSKRDH
jgi:BirA family biotin operon repressor/biotin-[acetyl-CoA-carboxylase] ligase